MKRYIFSVLIAIALTGCGSSSSGPSDKVAKVQPDPVKATDPVKASDVNAPKKIENAPADKQDGGGFGTLVISRDPTHPNQGCMIGVYLNKQLIHQFDADQKATFILPAGDQVVAVDSSDGRSSCPIGPGERHQLVLNIKAGDVKNLHAELLPGKGAVIEATAR
jgi:hypothetical protein